MDALIDVLMYVIIIGFAIIVVFGLGCGIVGMVYKNRHTSRICRNLWKTWRTVALKMKMKAN